MAKTKTSFFCQNCGTQYPKWLGQCKACNEWNTIVEELIQKGDKRDWKTGSSSKKASSALRITDISNISASSNPMTETHFIDTFPSSNSANFNGVWSVYPYFASGNIIMSDIEGGLFVVRKSE